MMELNKMEKERDQLRESLKKVINKATLTHIATQTEHYQAVEAMRI